MKNVPTQWFVNPKSGQKFQSTGDDIKYQRQRGMTPISDVEMVNAENDTTSDRINEIDALINSPQVKELAEKHGMIYGELSHAEKLLLARIHAQSVNIAGRPRVMTADDLAREQERLRAERDVAVSQNVDRLAQQNEAIAAQKLVAEEQNANKPDASKIGMSTDTDDKKK